MGRLAIIGAVLVLVLTGCAPERELPMPVPTTSPSSSASASAAPVDPQSSATAAQPLFDSVNATTIAGGTLGGRSFVDNLVAAGFDKSQMELTPDQTAIGLAADSIQFSVKYGSECLVGQNGNTGYSSIILPVLSTGKCFIGKTRAIDW